MRRKPDSRKVKRILVIRLGAIGDVVLSSVAVRNIKKRFPASEIDFCTKSRYVPLVSDNPNVHDIISVSKDTGIIKISRIIRKRSYDLVVDLQGNMKSGLFSLFSGSRFRTRSSMMRWKRFLLVRFGLNRYGDITPVPIRFLNAVREWGVTDDGKGAELYINSELGNRFSKELDRGIEPGTKGLIALAPGAGRATKRWPAERYGELARHYIEEGYTIALIGGDKDAAVERDVLRTIQDPVLDFIGRLSLQETAVVLKKADLVVTNDTGVMHMAAAQGRKLISLFGPTTAHLGFFPFRTRAVVVEKDLPCRPCSFHGTDQCPKDHFNCMLSIESPEVVDTADRLLNKG